jgi:hypothetical protein
MSELHIRPQLAGFYRIVATDADTGEQRVVADWFENLILDAGLNRLGTGGIASHCHVGSGSSTPAVSDTSLQSVVATQGRTGASDGVQNTEPYYGWGRYTFRFNAGVAAGNLSEVGIGWSASSGSLFSRALIKDVNGDPTTITVLSNEFLDVTYELRIYPPLTDATFQAVIGGVTHDCVLRACKVTDFWNWRAALGDNGIAFQPTAGTPVIVYSGAIGTITQYPSGSSGSASSYATNAYSNNSYTMTGYADFDLNSGNVAGGIVSMYFRTYAGTYQCSFDPPIAKDNTKTLRINMSVTWARKTL